MKRKSSPKNNGLLIKKKALENHLLTRMTADLVRGLPRSKRKQILIGVDEAGRGPLAGPVVAGAVLFNNSLLDEGLDIRDSKKLTPKKREILFFEILNRTGIGVGIIDEQDIDRMNIYRATILAMEKAVLELLKNIGERPKKNIFNADFRKSNADLRRFVAESICENPRAIRENLRSRKVFQRPFKENDNDKICILVDGNMKLNLPYKIKCIIGGDSKNTCIAAASIIAKVTRDRIMYLYDMNYPQYGFKAHKGYPTKAHFSALERYGPSPIHRRSFRPVRLWEKKN